MILKIKTRKGALGSQLMLKDFQAMTPTIIIFKFEAGAVFLEPIQQDQ